MSVDIESGAEFLHFVDKIMPVKAAFWLQEQEDEPWYLFIASDEISEDNIVDGYTKVMEAAQQVTSPYFDDFRVKLIPRTHPFAQSALEMYREYPASRPFWRGSTVFGDAYVGGLFLYPDPSAAPTP